MPTEDIFELAKVDVPEPKEGQFLVRNVWMSVDPYVRGRGAIDIGQIIESKN
jgi:NADPH-dependent curcumin reductase CurA